jgi:UDP-GlcNAc:undecaprenyl-phosphate GlcNAc-1-phosphate transferase
LILGLPIFDTTFAICRRILHGQSPMQPDRGHVHHRLIDMGFTQKQTVLILYLASGVLGVSAVLLTSSGAIRALLFVVAVLIAVFVGINIYRKVSKLEADKKENGKK